MQIKNRLVWTVGVIGALAITVPGTVTGQTTDKGKGERGKERMQQSQTEGARYSDRERRSE